MEIAYQLRIKSKLRKDKHGAKGVGSKFPTWSSKVPIQAQVIADVGKGPEFWGPSVPMNPAFAEHDAFLLGRADFFKGFKTVTFTETPANSTFFLDY